MDCVIYKSEKKADCYLYVEIEGEFGRVPESLLKMLGVLELVMLINLDERETLAQANPIEVKQILIDQGYFLQLPPKDYIADLV